MASIRILLVDDHPLARAGTRQLLESDADFIVVGEAADGEEALGLAARERPDLVVLDLNLPGLSGVDVARRLRSTLPAIRIVVLTGYALEPYEATLRRLGVEGYLAKSASAAELGAAIHAAHTGRQYIQPGLAASLGRPMAAGDGEAPTAREIDVLRLVATGSTNHEIAQRLAIRERTVEFHLDHVFRKLGAGSRTEAVHLARKHGWLAGAGFQERPATPKHRPE
ncbi:MAG: response regulator [Chloroflexota bacterium]